MVDSPEVNLAPYAVRCGDSGGRTHPEPDDPLRNPFELDRHRIIESTAFRRLEGKTQVFAPSHHDHFRTRLTHTLEAAQITRCLAAALKVNEALAEAITFAHDLGHPPFGHAGEAALDEAMASHGGFNHNAHSLRVVEYLEHPFPPFRGLNLTAETRAGLLAHATRYDTPESTTNRSNGMAPRAPSASAGRVTGRSRSPLGSAPHPNEAAPRGESPDDLPTAPSIEAQVASIADRIAYNCHDLEDAVGAGLISMRELTDVALWQSAYEERAARHGAKHIHAIRRLVLDTMLDGLLTDVVATSRGLLASLHSLEQVQETGHALVAPSVVVAAQLVELEQLLIEHVYQHPEVAEMDARGRRMVLALFGAYRSRPDTLPQRFSIRIDEQGPDRVICDYIAGMTDRFCCAQCDKIPDV